MSLDRVQIEKLKSLPWLDEIVARQRNMEFLPFEEARAYARSLGLKGTPGWGAWSRTQRPLGIPSHPAGVYKDEWQGWGDWLGTGKRNNTKGPYRPFVEARDYVRNLGLKSKTEWMLWHRSEERPFDIPSQPQVVYKDEFLGLGDWLGIERKAPFAEAREFARGLKLSCVKAWVRWAKSDARPLDIPAGPVRAYAGEWVSWGDWLGNGYTRQIEFLPFNEARDFVRNLKLPDTRAWQEWAKTQRPQNISSSPWITYKDEWVSWGDWLGNGRPLRHLTSRRIRRNPDGHHN